MDPESTNNGISMRTHTADPRASPRTLVLYVFHQSSEWYKENLRFFLHEAMLLEHDSETVDYMLVSTEKLSCLWTNFWMHFPRIISMRISILSPLC